MQSNFIKLKMMIDYIKEDVVTIKVMTVSAAVGVANALKVPISIGGFLYDYFDSSIVVLILAMITILLTCISYINLKNKKDAIVNCHY